jgi:hypothetical protein
LPGGSSCTRVDEKWCRYEEEEESAQQVHLRASDPQQLYQLQERELWGEVILYYRVVSVVWNLAFQHVRPQMTRALLLQELGQFIVSFQALEESISELIALIVQPDPEYALALAAELEFRSKLRALDVIYARFAQIHGLSNVAPHPEFHKLMTDACRAAERRNKLVHSHYALFHAADGVVGLIRSPTLLRPSKGERSDPNEDLTLCDLQSEVKAVQNLQVRLGVFRRQVVDALHPE